MPHTLAIRVSGSSTTLDRGQDPQQVVEPMRQHRFVGRLQGLDDLLEVLEHVPDALGGIGQVVKVDVQLLPEVVLLRALQAPGRRRAGGE